MVAAVNIGMLFKYDWPQGVLQCSGTLGQINPAAIPAVTKVKLAREAQMDNQMKVNGDKHRWSSDIEALHIWSLSIIQVSPILSDTTASLEPPPTFRMAQELTFKMVTPNAPGNTFGPTSNPAQQEQHQNHIWS